MNKYFYFLIFLSILSACQPKKTDNSVVQVFDQTLTIEDISDQIDDHANSEDSIRLAESIIENWVKKQMLISQAERNLPDSLKDFTRELEDEKNNLLIYTYEKEYISQKMDTSVSESEIQNYYTENQNSFKLRDYILLYSFIQVSDENKTLKKSEIKSKLSSFPFEDIGEIETYTSSLGGVFYTDTNWTYFENFLEKVPLDIYNVESFLKKQKFIEVETNNFRYFVSIHDYKLKDENSPLSLVNKKIKSLILNRRKQLTIKDLRARLYNEAVRENKITFFK